MVVVTELMVVKRNGEVTAFDQDRIKIAISKAINAVKGKVEDEKLDQIVTDIINELDERFIDFFPNVENIQDIVEKHLVKNGFYEIAKEYILYRAKRQIEREERKEKVARRSKLGRLIVKEESGQSVVFDFNKIKDSIAEASEDFLKEVNVDAIADEVIRNIYDGITTNDIQKALILASTSFIERDPAYSYVAGRLFLQKVYKEVLATRSMEPARYKSAFVDGLRRGVEAGLVDKRMLDYNLQEMAEALDLERDKLLQYMGLHTLYERYFMKLNEQLVELPQSFWMRVAMGLALNEENKQEKAKEFYNLLSSLKFVSSTPTLFHAGTTHPQLSSCYLTTVKDDLNHIFKCLSDNAQLSKWSGGLGNDWTDIRSTGALIKSTKVPSQGVIPFLKIANDVTVAINRSGKRRGATCAYLETWHLDIEDFIDLRKNTGDERRRTHDMNTSNWIPDLFMKRVLNDEDWTLFSPNDVKELHDLYGKKFEEKYREYEEKAKNGMMKNFKVVSAKKLWRKMLSMLFETGHPWITFKDPCNIRSPQDHCGVIHSSNLCTEITLNTSKEETAVCNLGSVNLARHIVDGNLDEAELTKTVKAAIRMLDNVVDLNFYPTVEAKNSNLKHRPIGLGIMGFQDALYKMDLAFESEEALDFSDSVMELISYNAILGSSELAKERGTYETYKGSKWDRGIFPVDTIEMLEKERGIPIEIEKKGKLDWTPVKEHVKQHGMRNSNTLAIAPTATISTISGCFPCIEPIYRNIYVKSNISGEFTVVNSYVVEELKQIGKWNKDMLDQLKYYDGSLQLIPGIPQNLKNKYKSAFEIDPIQALKMTARRGKWIDQSQSHNVFMAGTSGKQLSDIYLTAWKLGLKTTYYLRSLGASQVEKSTLDASKFGFTQKREYKPVKEEKVLGEVCTDESECEACQ